MMNLIDKVYNVNSEIRAKITTITTNNNNNNNNNEDDNYNNNYKSRGIFPREQKRCRKGPRGTREQLYIDQHILIESKTRRKNLVMAWVDYKKEHNTVPQSWNINCQKLYKISDKGINFIEKAMKT